MSKTLLLADDSVTIQKVVGISFASEDVELVTVDNGDDAIRKAREIRPDVVLADVVMPGKNGYEVCQALKADPELRHIPVVLLTGTFEAFDEERAEQVGAASHVAKPFEAQTLVDEVKRLLAAPPPAAAPAPRQATAPAARPAPRPAPPQPAAASFDAGSADDSFDFFDDDLSEFSRPPSRHSIDTAPPNTVDLAGDADFAFGDEAPAAAAEPAFPSFEDLAPPPQPPPADRTVAILPEEDPMGLPEPADVLVSAPAETGIGAADLEVFQAEPAPPPPPGPRAAEAPPRARPEPAGFDFDLGDGPGDSGPIDARTIAQEAVVDPKGVSGFTISSRDLGDASEPIPASAPVRAPAAAPTTPDLADTKPRTIAPLPPLEAEPIDDAEPLDEALSVGEPADELPLGGGESPLDAIAPRLREQLHETLEKVAWESFSDVTEKIVRQAVERVEQIAWEVIPHMAETLVREEIRRMKGEK